MSAMPKMMLTGVRRSWLTLATKSRRAWLAASAASFAAFSSSRARKRPRRCRSLNTAPATDRPQSDSMPQMRMPASTDACTVVGEPDHEPRASRQRDQQLRQTAERKGGEEADHEVEVAERQYLGLAAPENVVRARVRDEDDAEQRRHRHDPPRRDRRAARRRHRHGAVDRAERVDDGVEPEPLWRVPELEHRHRGVGEQEGRHRPRQVLAHRLRLIGGVAPARIVGGERGSRDSTQRRARHAFQHARAAQRHRATSHSRHFPWLRRAGSDPLHTRDVGDATMQLSRPETANCATAIRMAFAMRARSHVHVGEHQRSRRRCCARCGPAASVDRDAPRRLHPCARPSR